MLHRISVFVKLKGVLKGDSEYRWAGNKREKTEMEGESLFEILTHKLVID